jgi:hypothetical protein
MRKIVRRLGTSPRQRGSVTNYTCPDILVLDNDEIAVIGREGDQEILDQLWSVRAAVGPDEKLVIIPTGVYRSSLADYLEMLTLEEILQLLWPRLKRATAGLLDEWTETLRRVIAAWRVGGHLIPLSA